MKRLICLCAAACMLLSGCGEGADQAAYDPEAATAALLDAGGFSEPLERLENDIAFLMFGFDQWADSAAAIEGSAVYFSTGATVETAAVIQLSGEDAQAGEKAMERLRQWLAEKEEVLADYQPQEIPKLERAILEQRGDTILLVVTSDTDAARTALEGL